MSTRGGLIVWFEQRDFGLWFALACATHRDWAIEWVASNTDMALPAGRAAVLNVIVETMMHQAQHTQFDTCPCVPK